jgi:hypothetical protein
MNAEFWLQDRDIPLKANYLTLMAVHGALCLALRHPEFKGSVREIVVAFTQCLGKWLVDGGILSPEQLAEAQQLEASEGSRDLL